MNRGAGEEEEEGEGEEEEEEEEATNRRLLISLICSLTQRAPIWGRPPTIPIPIPISHTQPIFYMSLTTKSHIYDDSGIP